MRKILLILLSAFSLFGCMMGPNYQRPEVDTPQTWRFEDKEAKDVANTAWWEQFNDPVLNDLIQTALRENKDIKIAAARVEEFGGRYMHDPVSTLSPDRHRRQCRQTTAKRTHRS